MIEFNDVLKIETSEPLSEEEQLSYLKLAAKGDKNARKKLLECYAEFIVGKTELYMRQKKGIAEMKGIPVKNTKQDFYQIGARGLNIAIDRFDIRYNYKNGLKSYFESRIDRELSKFINIYNSHKKYKFYYELDSTAKNYEMSTIDLVNIIEEIITHNPVETVGMFFKKTKVDIFGDNVADYIFYKDGNKYLKDYIDKKLITTSDSDKAKNDKDSPSTSSIVDELKGLKELLDLGIITDEEFNKKKKSLLNL